MGNFDHLVREAHRITQESGLELNERVGIVDIGTKRALSGLTGSHVKAISGEVVTIVFAVTDEMESLDVPRNVLYALDVVTALYDGLSADEIIIFRKKIASE